MTFKLKTRPSTIERPVLRGELNYARGARAGNAKLTDEQVRGIIATIHEYPDAAVGALAVKHDVSAACISKIKCDRIWMHLQRPWPLGHHRTRGGS